MNALEPNVYYGTEACRTHVLGPAGSAMLLSFYSGAGMSRRMLADLHRRLLETPGLLATIDPQLSYRICEIINEGAAPTTEAEHNG